MALWIHALKVLPWKDMIDYAPTVVSGAQKLWQRVRKKNIEPTVPADSLPQSPETIIVELQQQVAELRTQQLDLSNLIKELADQNQRLVQAVDVLRMRTRILLVGFIAAGIALAALFLR